MIETEPQIFLIAAPLLNRLGVQAYLSEVGETIDDEGNVHRAVDWLDRVNNNGLSDAERLVEFMGRGCYRSWAPGLNANVTKVREDSTEYLRNILKSLHGSVLEHSQYSFMLHNVSRKFTHELCRHRAGVAISQESLRYVRLTELKVRVPPILEQMRDQVVSIVETLEDFQRNAAEQFGLDDDGVPFHYKKEVTSALRCLAPIGLSTSIGWSANVRTLRWVIQQRTAKGAEEEIRLVFSRVAMMMKHIAPALFGDFTQNEDGEWIPEFGKV